MAEAELSQLSSEQLQQQIRRARDEETQTKIGVYTLRGKKSLAGLAASMPHDVVPIQETASRSHEDDLAELKRLLQELKELEQEERKRVQELKKESSVRQERMSLAPAKFNNLMNQGRSSPAVTPVVIPSVVSAASNAPVPPSKPIPPVTPAVIPQVSSLPRIPSVPAPVAPSTPAPVPSVVPTPAPVVVPTPTPAAAPASVASLASDTPARPHSFVPAVPSALSAAPAAFSNPSSALKSPVIKGKKGKLEMGEPTILVYTVADIIFESKSKRSYIIDVTLDNYTWRINRNDEQLQEIGKKIHKVGADTVPFCPLVKKSLKPDSKADLQQGIEAWFQGLKKDLLFSKIKEKYLNFLAPFQVNDFGLGDFKGGTKDPEAWFCWKFSY